MDFAQLFLNNLAKVGIAPAAIIVGFCMVFGVVTFISRQEASDTDTWLYLTRRLHLLIKGALLTTAIMVVAMSIPSKNPPEPKSAWKNFETAYQSCRMSDIGDEKYEDQVCTQRALMLSQPEFVHLAMLKARQNIYQNTYNNCMSAQQSHKECHEIALGLTKK